MKPPIHPITQWALCEPRWVKRVAQGQLATWTVATRICPADHPIDCRHSDNVKVKVPLIFASWFCRVIETSPEKSRHWIRIKPKCLVEAETDIAVHNLGSITQKHRISTTSHLSDNQPTDLPDPKPGSSQTPTLRELMGKFSE